MDQKIGNENISIGGHIFLRSKITCINMFYELTVHIHVQACQWPASRFSSKVMEIKMESWGCQTSKYKSIKLLHFLLNDK